MHLYLVVASGKKKGQWIPIKADLFVMGSSENCQLRSHLQGIGPQHCAIVRRENKAFVRDLDSAGLTMLNERVVDPKEEWPLHSGDRLTVGPLQFTVRVREAEFSHHDLEEWGNKSMDKLDEAGEQYLWGKEPDGRPSTPADAAASILNTLKAERGITKGRLRIGLEAGITTVRFNDIYLVEEAELARIRRELHEHLMRPNLRILLDFKDVRRMSSLGVQMIEALHCQIINWGSSLALCRMEPEILKNLKKLQLLVKVPYFKDKASALKEPW
jgi:anti-anti-sigma regulatory factor